MKFAALVAAFAGWGVVGGYLSTAQPGFAFLVGIAVGAGAMLASGRK